MALRIDGTREGPVLRVRVRPQAPRAGLDGEHGDGSLKVSVRAPPERGRANDEVVEVIAAALGLARAAVEVVGGGAARQKRVLVRGLTVEDVRARIETSTRAGPRTRGTR